MLVHGFPREASIAVEIGGVRTNFRMPDVLSFGLGGGSLVREAGQGVRIGPDSVGYELTTRGRDQALEAAESEASSKAIAAGADPTTIRVVDVEDIPLSYLPGNALRVRVKAIGDLL